MGGMGQEWGENRSAWHQIRTCLNLKEFTTTEIDEALIAKAANIGLIKRPSIG